MFTSPVGVPEVPLTATVTFTVPVTVGLVQGVTVTVGSTGAGIRELDSMSGHWPPVSPTATQNDSDAHDTPDRLPSLSGNDGVESIDHVESL